PAIARRLLYGRVSNPPLPSLPGSLRRLAHENVMELALRFAGSRAAQHVLAVGVQLPRQPVVVQRLVQNIAQTLAQRGIAYRRHQLDAVVQIAPAPVGAADVILRLPIVVEVEDAIVFQEAAQDADDAD